MIAPLVKWAGGKRQLLKQLNVRLPESFNTYFEPFVGGGALLTDLFIQEKISRAVIADLNGELINLYTVVKKRPDVLSRELASEQFRNDRESFNRIKAEFNTLIGRKGHEVTRAAHLIYLNKHGFNGLWRVNSKGEYNVPFGNHARRSIPSPASIGAFSGMLQDITIKNTDFETTVKSAKQGDFVYFDPPYHPVSKTAAFTDYNSRGFTFADQERLAKVFARLAKRGVFVMLSNSKMPEVEELYEGFTIATVEAKRFINCKGQKRNGCPEIIVTSYEPETRKEK